MDLKPNIFKKIRKINRSNILLLLLIFIFSSCVNYEEVSVTDVRSAKIEKVEGKKISISAEVSIHNPNTFQIKVVETDADLFIDGKFAGKANLQDAVIIPGDSHESQRITVITDLSEGNINILAIMMGTLLKDKVEIRATGSVRAKSGLLSRNIQFDETELVDLRN